MIELKEITAQSKPIKNLLEDNIFNIPIYQRNYSWKKENVETLLNDIWDNEQGYYIGNVLLVGNGKGISDVVDGQQRLTTIFLILLSLYEQFYRLKSKIEDTQFREDINDITKDISKYLGLSYRNSFVEEPQNLHLKLLDEDQKLLQNCIDFAQCEGFEKSKPNNANCKLVLRYLDIKYSIEEKIKDKYNDLSSKEACRMLFNLYDKTVKAIVLPITLEDLSDVFAIFSSMNSKGQPLTTIDLLKADYLSAVSKSNVDDSVGYNEWNNFIDILSLGNNELKVSDANRFLQNNYDTFYNETSSSITVKQSLSKYQMLFSKFQNNILDFVKELQRHAKIYACIESNFIENKKLLTYIGEENNNSSILLLLQELQKLDVTSAYPILFSILDKTSKKVISTQDCESIIKYLKHFYIRRNVIKRPKSSNLRQRFLNILRKAEKDQEQFVSIILDGLKLTATQYLDNKAFKEALSSPIYSDDIKMTRILLEEIEKNAISTNQETYFDKQNPYNLDDTKIWSIEHILPQDIQLKNGWKLLFESMPKNKITEEHKKYKDLLGNLTLTGYNSEMGNKSFIEKRDFKDKTGKMVGLKTGLYLNQSIFNGNINKDTWTLEDIERRTNVLSDELINIFDI